MNEVALAHWGLLRQKERRNGKYKDEKSL